MSYGDPCWRCGGVPCRCVPAVPLVPWFHTGSYIIPYPTGWQCPCCRTVHAPDVRECKCQAAAIQPYTRQPNTCDDRQSSADLTPITSWG